MLKQVLEIIELVDRPDIAGKAIRELFSDRGLPGVEVEPLRSEKGSTQIVRAFVPGNRGRSGGGDAPTLGVIGFLGGVGARPESTGLVSDGDGAVAALAVGLKLADMYRLGDRLPGDVTVVTHVCPDAPVAPHEPVSFMGSPVGTSVLSKNLVEPRMEGILSIDTTKGNQIINHRGFAISPTVKQGYILRVDDLLLGIQQQVTGRPSQVFAVTTQDITPYGNGLYHLNSILQPATVTAAPVVGVAITAEVAVPGGATGASQEVDIEQAARFAVEVAKAFSSGRTRLYDPEEFEKIERLYGTMTHLQTPGRN